VRGFADLLEADAAPVLAPRDRSYLTALREAAGHAEEMLDGLAAYGRLAHGEALARDVDCDRTLDAVLDDLAEELEARDAVVTRAPLPVVPGDPEELRTLFSNLIANAVRHCGVERPQVHVGAERRGLGWQLSFADDGDGVPPAERQRIFQLFRRLHPRGAHRGSGVGLALCRRIVERHGGAIWVDEAERGGSVFCVSLPDREAR
jgi:signal transduction histidine kinase